MTLDFPRLVYRIDNAKGAMPVPGVGLVACRGVNDAAEHGVALADGWVDSVPELTAEAPVADGAPTRDEMLAQAAKLGIEVDKRWGDKRLMAAIEKAMG
jgi:hypothetical protein